ncbi:DUF3853 family protein [Ornithobacterium rhinotracheale]|uniref:DUF3853 family protein n=1 Tax=Ornithobacterium rhinotracheale TaxID=28251 RepID=UPI00129C78A4|nr:DUF3853 family protein [Ornithobacterium rhinotracheale]MRJ09692.1 DUF3853 family protein [Ornithobacterium rhinotracheale]
MNDLYKTPITDLSVGELIDIINQKKVTPTPPKIEKKYVYGLKGLADLLGCSKTHAFKLKQSGIFDKAIIQNGKKIIVDAELALKLFKVNYD